MTSSITRGHDTYTFITTPNTPYSDAATLSLATGIYDVYVYLPLPDDIAGQTITSATLACHLAAATGVSQVFTTKLLTSTWAASSCTYNNHPSFPGSGGVTTTVPISAVGAEVDIDVPTLLQAVASGQAYYGFHISTTVAATLYSFESGVTSWVLTVSYSEAPETPQSLVPNGTVVGSGAPVLTCDFVDNGGLSQDMAQMNVQVNSTNSWGSPSYDHTISTTVPVFDLSANSFTAISSGVTRWWRVRVQDANGNWSGWSDPTTFQYIAQPSITLNSPASGILYDPATEIIATSSTNLSKFRVQITSATDRTDVLFDSGATAANPSNLTQIAASLAPTGAFGGQVGPFLTDDTATYQLRIQAWDTNLSRQGTPGSPAYAQSWTTFVFNDDSGVTAPASLAATQPDAGPSVSLTWTRSTAPTAYVIKRDGTTIDRIDGPGAFISGTTYGYVDPHPPNWTTHTYRVKAVNSSSHQSQPSNTATITVNAIGIWIRTQSGSQVCIETIDTSSLTVPDRLSTYSPVNSRYDVDVIASHAGLQGTLSGTLSGAVLTSQTVPQAQAILLGIRENPTQWVHMVFGSFAGRVLLRNISVTPSALGNGTVPVLNVSFGVNQTSDFGSVY